MSAPPAAAAVGHGLPDVQAVTRHAVAYEATAAVRLLGPRVPVDGPTSALIALHGYGQPPDSILAFAASVVGGETVVVVPEGPSTFYRRPGTPGGASKGGVGHGWIADPIREATDRRNDGLIGHSLDLAASAYALDPERIWILGYSQGVGVATHFFAAHPGRLAGLVGLAGGVPRAHREGLRTLAGKPVLWVSGTRDASYRPAYTDAVVAAWRAAGAAIETAVLDTGHALLPAAHPIVRDWFSKHLA